MIKKVISGGQTGADIAGLIAAKKLGIPTGGTMPKGFRTLKGPRPEYAKLYGIKEHASYAYPPRTECNVKDSDGTIRFATHWESAGEKCTLKLIQKHGKPWYDIDPSIGHDPLHVVEWMLQHNIQILNVAGNSEETSPGIAKFVIEFLTRVLSDD
jgi:hypothetical protein